MKLENCWKCDSDKVDILPGDSWVSCNACGAHGPGPDPEGLLWREMYLLGRRGYTPMQPAQQVTATLEVAEVGPMPWRLQIAAQAFAAGFADPTWEPTPEGIGPWLNTLVSLADGLIAAHSATEGGAA